MKNSKKKYLHILWETVPLPRSWDYLWEGEESIFDGFFAASYFLVYQLKTITRKPVYYIPYYIQVPKKYIDIERKVLTEDKFTVLIMGQDTVRKGLDEGLIAFNRAFNNIEDVQLVIKYHNLDVEQYNNFEQKILRISQSNSSCKKNNIYILNKEMPQDEIYDLYRSSSVLLMPSRGEGFCLPIAEAMSIGLPCVYTDWSAMTEVGKSKHNRPVKFHLDESIGMFQYGYEIGSVYAYPSVLSIMRSLYSLYDMWKKDKKNYYKQSYNNINLIDKRYNKNIISDCLIHLFKGRDEIAPANIFDIEYLKLNENLNQDIINLYKEN